MFGWAGSTSNAIALSIVLGTTLGLGLTLCLAALPRWRAPSLAVRVAPYLRDILPDDVLPTAVRTHLLDQRRGLGATARWRERVLWRIRSVWGGETLLERRLTQSGSALSVEQFRSRQLAWAIAAAAGGVALAIALAVLGRRPASLIFIPVLAALIAVVSYEQLLSYRARRRLARIDEELPTMLEFLALCLAAGETLNAAIARLGIASQGELARELDRVTLSVGGGSPLIDALDAMARHLDVPSLTRAVSQITASLERGSPVAQVLQAQAADAREESRRQIIESAGRKEITMLLPVVFVILPLSIIFAIFPGLSMLDAGFE